MSGSIKDVERQNMVQIESLNRRQQREVKLLENGHQNYKADLKKNHQAELDNMQIENHQRLSLEQEKKEKVLTEMLTNLDASKQLADKQLKAVQIQSSR